MRWCWTTRPALPRGPVPGHRPTAFDRRDPALDREHNRGVRARRRAHGRGPGADGDRRPGRDDARACSPSPGCSPRRSPPPWRRCTTRPAPAPSGDPRRPREDRHQQERDPVAAERPRERRKPREILADEHGEPHAAGLEHSDPFAGAEVLVDGGGQARRKPPQLHVGRREVEWMDLALTRRDLARLGVEEHGPCYSAGQRARRCPFPRAPAAARSRRRRAARPGRAATHRGAPVTDTARARPRSPRRRRRTP